MVTGTGGGTPMSAEEAYAFNRIRQMVAAGMLASMPKPGPGGYAAIWRGLSGSAGLQQAAGQAGFGNVGMFLRNHGVAQSGGLAGAQGGQYPGAEHAVPPSHVGGGPAFQGGPTERFGSQIPPQLMQAILAKMASAAPATNYVTGGQQGLPPQIQQALAAMLQDQNAPGVGAGQQLPQPFGGSFYKLV